MYKLTGRKWIRILWGFLIAVVIILLIWSVVAGPVTVYRVVTRGDTTVYDYERFPGRKLSASPTPFRFDVKLQDNIVPDVIRLKDAREIPFDELLENSGTLAFVIVKDDTIVYERYLHEHSQAGISQVFSVSKSILSILIGAAVDDGLIASVNDPVTVYVPELAEGGFDKVTIEDLLNMQSNMDYFENDNPFGEHVIFNFTDHLEDEILTLRVRKKPDEQFRYRSGDNALLGLILDRVLGDKTITQYMQERLWSPLGMEYGGVWGVDRMDGLERTWCCLSITARDLAKFGRLYLQHGTWNGTQIISSDWIEISTTSGAYDEASEWPEDLTNIWNYKYQWWLISMENGDYSALGKDGQYLYVDPGRNLIIVRLGDGTGNLSWLDVIRQITIGIQ